MQGINTIFFERGVTFNYSSDYAKQLSYINSIVDALKLACPGWFDNIELVVTTDSSDRPTYFIKFIINNISLLEITMFTCSYNWGQFRIRTYYNNGNNYYTPFLSRGDSYASDQTAYISSIIYSKNFCAIETSTRTGAKKSTTIVICKSNINNTVVILPSVAISEADSTDLLTAYHYTTKNYTESTGYRISACTVYSSFRLPNEGDRKGDCNNKIWNSYFKGSSFYNNEKTEALQSRTFINKRFIFSPMYITGRTDEYCPDVYYVQNSPVVLSSACNAVLEIGKDYYFTNGIIAIKLT